MVFPSSRKINKYHLKCVVCQKSFGSVFDPEIIAYPIYHPKSNYPNSGCQDKFYRVLMGIYKYLLGQEISVPVNQILTEISALNDIIQKKDMLTWLLARGYLQVDGLKRVDIPDVILELFESDFSEAALCSMDERVEAAEWIQVKLRLIKDGLQPVSPDQMPFKQSELRLGESTLFDRIDTSGIELKREKKRDSDSRDRMSSIRTTRDRRR